MSDESPVGTLAIAKHAIQVLQARRLLTPALGGASWRTARRAAESLGGASAACGSHSALDGGLTRAELLATGHGEAVRTAAVPAQPPRRD